MSGCLPYFLQPRSAKSTGRNHKQYRSTTKCSDVFPAAPVKWPLKWNSPCVVVASQVSRCKWPDRGQVPGVRLPVRGTNNSHVSPLPGSLAFLFDSGEMDTWKHLEIGCFVQVSYQVGTLANHALQMGKWSSQHPEEEGMFIREPLQRQLCLPQHAPLRVFSPSQGGNTSPFHR